MTTANNAVYTPSPKTVAVVVYHDQSGEVRVTVDDGRDYLIQDRGGEIVRHEVAVVTWRGDLNSRGDFRWHGVRLSDGTDGRVLLPGS